MSESNIYDMAIRASVIVFPYMCMRCGKCYDDPDTFADHMKKPLCESSIGMNLIVLKSLIAYGGLSRNGDHGQYYDNSIVDFMVDFNINFIIDGWSSCGKALSHIRFIIHCDDCLPILRALIQAHILRIGYHIYGKYIERVSICKETFKKSIDKIIEESIISFNSVKW